MPNYFVLKKKFTETLQNGENCYICNASCSLVVINSELPADAKFYFEDPDELLQKLKKVCL